MHTDETEEQIEKIRDLINEELNEELEAIQIETKARVEGVIKAKKDKLDAELRKIFNSDRA